LNILLIDLRNKLYTMQVLALSSSRVGNSGYLEQAAPLIGSFLGNSPKKLAFIPFAAVDGNYEAYGQKVREGLSGLPFIIEVATPNNAAGLIADAEAIVVGGGNTFKLLHDIYQFGLFSLVQQKVQSGTPYIGWSAGANLTGKTICTTNDMPVIQPKSFAAFHFLPFQINPHYHNVTVEGFHGETRDQRLTEYLLLNPCTPIVGMPEGTALMLKAGNLQLQGELPAVLFSSGINGELPAKKEIRPGEDLSFLLHQ
jgi:dipeptidase E